MQRHAYYNGRWVTDTGLTIPIADPGFMLGATVTERLRTFNGRVWRQAEHTARLRRSCQIVGIDTAVADELDHAIGEWAERHEPLRQAAAVVGGPSDWSIAAFATPGQADQPTRCVHGRELPFASWSREYEEGVALRASTHRQVPAACWPPELKCRSRMHYYLADREAHAADPGARALLLDTDGHVGEASTANVVAYRRKEGVVSPIVSKVLPGVSLTVVRELAESIGIAFVERDMTTNDLATADEVWLTSTSVCFLHVARLDGRPIAEGRAGPVGRRILEAWKQAAGLDFVEQAVRRGGATD